MPIEIFIVDQAGKKTPTTLSELDELAKAGVIYPDTIIEAGGRQAPASKIRKLEGAFEKTSGVPFAISAAVAHKYCAWSKFILAAVLTLCGAFAADQLLGAIGCALLSSDSELTDRPKFFSPFLFLWPCSSSHYLPFGLSFLATRW